MAGATLAGLRREGCAMVHPRPRECIGTQSFALGARTLISLNRMMILNILLAARANGLDFVVNYFATECIGFRCKILTDARVENISCCKILKSGFAQVFLTQAKPAGFLKKP